MVRVVRLWVVSLRRASLGCLSVCAQPAYKRSASVICEGMIRDIQFRGAARNLRPGHDVTQIPGFLDSPSRSLLEANWLRRVCWLAEQQMLGTHSRAVNYYSGHTEHKLQGASLTPAAAQQRIRVGALDHKNIDDPDSSK
jgi:hypothetical protein